MHELMLCLGQVSEPRCATFIGRHAWNLLQRRSMPMATPAGAVFLFVLRWECRRCHARALVQTVDVDHLWLLGVEVPAAEEAIG